MVTHRVGVGHGVDISAPDGPLEYAWSIDAVAKDDDRWIVRLRLDNLYVDLGPQDAQEFARAAMQGAAWAGEFREDDLKRRVRDLEGRLDHWLDVVNELDDTGEEQA
ncbi:hypothetical protein [Nocardioides korecus]